MRGCIVMIILLDTREPDPHPWQRYLPEGWRFERECLETGDLCLSAIPNGIVVERKTAGDLAGCLGASRERFERELKRSRYCGRFLIVVEGSLADVIGAARGFHHSAVIGTIAAWSVRYAPILFCGSVQVAAQVAFSALRSQIRDSERGSKALQEALG